MKSVAPGKLILSGEHAVVHGSPALVTAVSRYASATVTDGADGRISVATPFGKAVFSPDDLRRRLVEARSRYQTFLAGHLPIAEVVPAPMDFLALAWPLVDAAPTGIHIQLESTIPPGSGMGSSAAVSAVLLQALSGCAGAPLDADGCEALSLEMEQFQHGHPSGIDSHVTTRGGMIRYTKGVAPVSMRFPSLHLHLVHTGVPEVTTGECVEQVRGQFSGSSIWSEFSAVTAAVESALVARDRTRLLDAVRWNHRLLDTIGVVPAQVAAWITEVECAGGAAKICGGGAVRGDAGGMVWVIDQAGIDSPYESIMVQGEDHGVRLID